jgi:hypothetical protein
MTSNVQQTISNNNMNQAVGSHKHHGSNVLSGTIKQEEMGRNLQNIRKQRYS